MLEGNGGSWAQAPPHSPPPQQIPWLMLSLHRTSASQCFFSVSDRKMHRLTLNKKASGAICCGSFDNWLVLSHGTHGDFLHNPFKNLIIPLRFRSRLTPQVLLHYSRDDPFLIRKVILSNPPLDVSGELNICIVAAIFDQSFLAICKLKTRGWLVVEYFPGFEDLIFHRGKLHVIDCNENIFRITIGNDVPYVRATMKEELIMQSRFHHSYELDYKKCVYIVTSCINGELLMVLRYLKQQINYGYTTRFFKVYELDCKSNAEFGTWKEKENLHEEAIFLSQTGSRAIMSSEKLGFVGNCIYFLEDREHFSRIHPCDDMGVFHMKDASIEKLIQNRYNSSFSPPAWFFVSNNIGDY